MKKFSIKILCTPNVCALQKVYYFISKNWNYLSVGCSYCPKEIPVVLSVSYNKSYDTICHLYLGTASHFAKLISPRWFTHKWTGHWVLHPFPKREIQEIIFKLKHWNANVVPLAPLSFPGIFLCTLLHFSINFFYILQIIRILVAGPRICLIFMPVTVDE